ncbi:carbohydrate esterase family 16 protein [Tulasnella calospora MUT 4182]|uniref:Carbohydrate esterase family 16 protein n=1 Tax=Tulasnella calospora MUT 4182 TaxID=1051891 RepID=A0A0C3LC25_9AGAM|nr:carbohydrate esterase family 16 protein [Tulasnella calospora MUT 4182]
MVRLVTILAATASLLGTAQACWEQCGGIGWTGSTACSDTCVCTYQNDWYYQCLPPSTTTTTTSKTSSSSSKTSSTTTTTKSSSTTTTTKSSTTTTKSSTTTTTTTKSSSSTSKSSTTTSTPVPTATPKYWFSFGDSYTQTYFDITSTKPNDANPFGNPVYPGYTACGAVTNWIDEVIVTYNESQIYAYNFAYGGATIDATIVAPYISTVLSMTDQMNEFLNNVASHPSYAPWTSANSMFSFFIGINDVSGTWYQDWGNWTAYTPTLMNAYFALVQKAYDAGGRNFLFVNVPAVERSPYVASLGSADDVATPLGLAIAGYNAELINRVNAFKAANSGVKTWIYDSYTRLDQILDSPTSYGFQDATSYGSATNLAWCNDFHVSPGVHHYFAQDVGAVLAGSGF